MAPVRGAGDLRDFLRVPFRLYASRPQWVPPLLFHQKRLLDRRRHPFWGHAEGEYFLARRGRVPVGRVAAIRDRHHDERHGERAGFFGFLETEEDPGTAAALLDAARGWLRGRGASFLRGPVSPSLNYEAGLLVEGFEKRPFFMMPWNPPSVPALLEACGLRKSKDLLTFLFTPRMQFPEKVVRVAEAARRRSGVVLRTISLRSFREEAERIRLIYNRAWADNWGFVPLDAEEFHAEAAGMKDLLDPTYAVIAEAGGQAIGFALCLPDLNEVLPAVRGRLLPFGFLRILRWKKRYRWVRLLTMGVLPEFRGRGVDALFYSELHRRAREVRPIGGGELSWVLEDNEALLRILRGIGARPRGRYRIYDGAL